METRETVSELLQRIGRGDPDEIAALYADRVSWKLDWPPGEHPHTPWIRPRSSRAGVAEHFRLIAEHHIADQSAARIDAVLVDGDEAIIVGELRNTARPTRRSYAAAFALHLTVQDGRITRHHVYEDSLSVARAFEPSGSSPGMTAAGDAEQQI